MDNSFQISAVFIGASFALAALLHYEKLVKEFRDGLRYAVLLSTMVAAVTSLVSSRWLCDSIKTARFSVYSLLVSYLLLFFVLPLGLGKGVETRKEETNQVIEDQKLSRIEDEVSGR